MANGDILEGGWLLEGVDGQGTPVRLRFADRDINRARYGLTLGRHPELADSTLDDPSVSRRHVRLTLSDGNLVLEDLNSLNGTVLNGEDLAPFEPTTCGDGTMVQLGRIYLTVHRIGETQTGNA